MSNLSEWLPNYKTQLGEFIDPHPTMDSLTADLPFVPAEQREGREFKVPVVVTLEQGARNRAHNCAFKPDVSRSGR